MGCLHQIKYANQTPEVVQQPDLLLFSHFPKQLDLLKGRLFLFRCFEANGNTSGTQTWDCEAVIHHLLPFHPSRLFTRSCDDSIVERNKSQEAPKAAAAALIMQ